MKKKTRILILAANPKDSTRLRLDEEIRDIKEGIQRSKFRDQFEIETWTAVRSKDIRRLMLRYKPEIVHFHGQLYWHAFSDSLTFLVLGCSAPKDLFKIS